MPHDEQRKIFQHYPDGIRKVILATNIAETSITIDDVVYVVDSGIQKENRFDVEKGITVIDNHWISKASMAQRKGRAGRVQAGEAFLLYPKSKFDEFSDYSIPEIQRTSLTKIVLDSKVYSNNMKAAEFLGQLITPPETSAIARAVKELIELDLLDAEENLTPLGKVISDFQLEPKLAKALVNSVIYKCVTPVVDIVTYFSAEMEVFAGGLVEKEKIKSMKQDFSQSSDHLSMMRLFEKWLELVEDGRTREADAFCKSHNLVDYKLRTLQQLRDIHFGYLHKGLHDILPISDDNSDSDELVKAVLLSGLGTVLQRRHPGSATRKRGHAIFNRHDQRVSLSSESVNHGRGTYTTNYLVYINETRSNIRRSTVIRETSFITPLTTLLFMNNRIVMEPITTEDFNPASFHDPVVVRLEGTRIAFLTERKHALLLCKCKEALTGGVAYYIYQLTKGAEYDKDVNQLWNGILKSLNECLCSAAENITF